MKHVFLGRNDTVFTNSASFVDRDTFVKTQKRDYVGCTIHIYINIQNVYQKQNMNKYEKKNIYMQ